MATWHDTCQFLIHQVSMIWTRLLENLEIPGDEILTSRLNINRKQELSRFLWDSKKFWMNFPKRWGAFSWILWYNFNFQVIFAQPKNIPLYCAQLLENRLNERLRNEENQLKEELLKQKLKDDYKRQIDQAREEFRKKSKSSNQKRHCESQTGFTTDSGKNLKMNILVLHFY